jgi:hypothetical protein
MAKSVTIAISHRALKSRINRVLARARRQLRADRRGGVIRHLLIDTQTRHVVETDVDLNKLARRLDVLEAWERVQVTARVLTVDLLERVRIAAPENPWLDVPIAADLWTELMRRRRKDGRFLHPTTFDLGRGTAEERQRAAIWLLFSLACDIAENPRPIMLRRELEAKRTDLQTEAKTLRNIVATTVQLGLRRPHRISSDPELHYINPLIVAAEEAQDLAAQLGDRGIVIERDHGNMRERAVAVGIANMCRLLFDRTMPAIVVGLVKILLERDIQAFEVQNWCRANR